MRKFVEFGLELGNRNNIYLHAPVEKSDKNYQCIMQLLALYSCVIVLIMNHLISDIEIQELQGMAQELAIMYSKKTKKEEIDTDLKKYNKLQKKCIPHKIYDSRAILEKLANNPLFKDLDIKITWKESTHFRWRLPLTKQAKKYFNSQKEHWKKSIFDNPKTKKDQGISFPWQIESQFKNEGPFMTRDYASDEVEHMHSMSISQNKDKKYGLPFIMATAKGPKGFRVGAYESTIIKGLCSGTRRVLNIFTGNHLDEPFSNPNIVSSTSIVLLPEYIGNTFGHPIECPYSDYNTDVSKTGVKFKNTSTKLMGDLYMYCKKEDKGLFLEKFDSNTDDFDKYIEHGPNMYSPQKLLIRNIEGRRQIIQFGSDSPGKIKASVFDKLSGEVYYTDLSPTLFERKFLTSLSSDRYKDYDLKTSLERLKVNKKNLKKQEVFLKNWHDISSGDNMILSNSRMHTPNNDSKILYGGLRYPPYQFVCQGNPQLSLYMRAHSFAPKESVKFTYKDLSFDVYGKDDMTQYYVWTIHGNKDADIKNNKNKILSMMISFVHKIRMMQKIDFHISSEGNLPLNYLLGHHNKSSRYARMGHDSFMAVTPSLYLKGKTDIESILKHYTQNIRGNASTRSISYDLSCEKPKIIRFISSRKDFAVYRSDMIDEDWTKTGLRHVVEEIDTTSLNSGVKWVSEMDNDQTYTIADITEKYDILGIDIVGNYDKYKTPWSTKTEEYAIKHYMLRAVSYFLRYQIENSASRRTLSVLISSPDKRGIPPKLWHGKIQKISTNLNPTIQKRTKFMTRKAMIKELKNSGAQFYNEILDAKIFKICFYSTRKYLEDFLKFKLDEEEIISEASLSYIKKWTVIYDTKDKNGKEKLTFRDKNKEGILEKRQLWKNDYHDLHL